MGDFGARMLAKALQINTKLQTIYWDRNHTTSQGFQDIAAALNKYVVYFGHQLILSQIGFPLF